MLALQEPDIDQSVETRQAFSFASPAEIIRALQVYNSSHYGSMLWDMEGDAACQYFNSWTTAVKLSWDYPRDTRTYLVQQVLSCDQTTARADALTRYGKFFKSLRDSTSREVATMANLVSRVIKTTTGKTMSSGLSAWDADHDKLKDAIKMKETDTVDCENKCRIPY